MPIDGRSVAVSLADILDGFHQAAEVVGEDVADVTDAERVGLRYLARIDDEAPFFQFEIEGFEVETFLRIVERRDDGRLLLVGQQGAEAQPWQRLWRNCL